MALTTTPPGEKGQLCPDFNLPGTDGLHHSRKDLPRETPFLIMFICNHCPYVKAIEDRLITLGQDLKKIGVPVIAISSNDADKYPDDGFSEMKKKNYPFPYLYDESQSVARAFGAVCTPDFFLFDRQARLAYRGRLDDNWKEPQKVSQRELFIAAQDLVANKLPSGPEKPSMGCSIKWKE